MASWLEWRAKNKPTKPILASINRPPASFASMAAGVNRPVPVKSQPPAVQPQPNVLTPVTAAVVVPKQPVVLPTRPVICSTASLQTVRAMTSQAVAVTTGRTIATTTLTAAQLQQLAAARGQVFSALQSQLKAGTASFTMSTGAGGVRQVAVSQISGLSRPGQLISGQALVRGQTGLIVSQQPRAQTVTVQRPQVNF